MLSRTLALLTQYWLKIVCLPLFFYSIFSWTHFIHWFFFQWVRAHAKMIVLYLIIRQLKRYENVGAAVLLFFFSILFANEANGVKFSPWLLMQNTHHFILNQPRKHSAHIDTHSHKLNIFQIIYVHECLVNNSPFVKTYLYLCIRV